MSTLVEQRKAAYDAAAALIEDVKAGDVSAIEKAEAQMATVKQLDEQIATWRRGEALIDQLAKDPGDTPEQQRKGGASSGGIGARFVQSDEFRAFRKSNPSGVGSGTPISIKAGGLGGLKELGFKAATLDTSVGQTGPERLPGYVDTLIYRPNSILDLVTTGSTASTSLEYMQIVSETDGAAIVAEGALKPLSDVTTALADAKAFTYADGFDATNQFLADEPALATWMDSAVRRHLRNKIEDVLLNGEGTATEPAGILNTSGVQAQAFSADVITTIALALEKVNAVNAVPQAVVLNPSDAWALRLLKDGEGRYLSGGPFSVGAVQTLWGVPVVESWRVAAGTAVVGDFTTVNLLEREALNVLLFNQHKDYAQRNMVYVRAELRAMQLIFEPRNLVVATLHA